MFDPTKHMRKNPQQAAPLGYLYRRSVAPPIHRSALLLLHEVVEIGLGEPEPEVRVAAEGRVIVADLFAARVFGRAVGVSGHGLLEGHVHHVFGERKQLDAAAHSTLAFCSTDSGSQASVLTNRLGCAPSGHQPGHAPYGLALRWPSFCSE